MALEVGEKLEVVKASVYNQWINFMLETKREISVGELQEIQKEAGFHPAGYGFYSMRKTPFGYIWQCAASCD